MKKILTYTSIILLIILISLIILKVNKPINYENKIIKIFETKEKVKFKDIFEFEFDRAYFFALKDCYLNGEQFAKTYNLDISINEVKEGEADYINRIIFVDKNGNFIYEFKFTMDKLNMHEKGIIIYPETTIEKDYSDIIDGLYLKINSTEYLSEYKR